jgi:hypothetical protein
MKSFTNRLVIFAASAVVLGTMAYGQTMNAQIPFAFHTANASLTAGNYTINRVSGASMTNVLRLYNADSHRSVYMSGLPLDPFHTAAEKAVMVFACTEQTCTLREIKTSNGTYAYPASHKNARNHDDVALIEIPLSTRNGD